jgi:hypothetical protein
MFAAFHRPAPQGQSFSAVCFSTSTPESLMIFSRLSVARLRRDFGTLTGMDVSKDNPMMEGNR